MAADRAEHVALVIEPALVAGTWVVSDRFSASTVAYQGYGRGLDPGALADLVAWAADGVTADLSVLVDVRVEVAAARLAAAGDGGGVDRMERLGPQSRGTCPRGVLGAGGRGPRAVDHRRRRDGDHAADGAYRGVRA